MFDPGWWQRPDLRYADGSLCMSGHDLARLARRVSTPLFVYSADRVRDNLLRLHAALGAQQLEFSIYYALKANRFAPLIAALRSWGLCGIDACSPGELLLARQHGFAESEISYTGTSVANSDLDLLAAHPGIHVNCDALSTIRRLGERAPGRRIGIRINPRVGAGYHAGLHYSGVKPSKFGIYRDRFVEALELAARHGMRVTQLHFHFGSGYLTPQLPQLEQALEHAAWFLEQAPDIDTLDVGGGMGVPVTADRLPLDLDLWAALIARFARSHNLKIHLEPGDYLVKDAGALIAQVNTVEEKGGTTFVGVDAGFNLQNLAAYYQTPFIVAPLRAGADPDTRTVTVAGNINEAIDLLAEDVCLPIVHEGDYIAFLNAGGYGASSSSNHCMRGAHSEYLLEAASTART